MADKQLIIVVEGTCAMGPCWKTIVSDYLDKIIRSFCYNDVTAQKSTGSTFELALVIFNTKGPYSAYVVQRSGWTRDVDNFFSWLSSISFSGGGFSDVATTEGLAEALMMFAIPQNGYQTQQNLDGKRHCILVSASNPYPLPTPVYRPALEILGLAETGEEQIKSRLYDAETVSKWFGQCSVSLSVICPIQQPKLRDIYNAAKRGEKTSEPAIDVKQPHFLVLISDNFIEACTALGHQAVPPNENLVSTLPPGSDPPVLSPSANESDRLSVCTVHVPQPTIKVEPNTATSVSTQAHKIITNGDSATECGPVISTAGTSQPLRNTAVDSFSAANSNGSKNSNLGISQPPTYLPGSVSNTLGPTVSGTGQGNVPSMSQPHEITTNNVSVPERNLVISTTGTSQPMQNTAISSFSDATSNVSKNSNLGISQTVSGTGQGNVPSMSQSGINGGPSVTGTILPTPRIPQQALLMQSVGMNESASNVPMSQQGSSSIPSSQSRYVRVWEGDLYGVRLGQLTFFTKLEGYRSEKCPETIAANWPPAMHIARCMSQDFMSDKRHAGKADFLVFRALHKHVILTHLQDKKVCAVVHLPSQTLLLSVTDKTFRLIGMLFDGILPIGLKPQIPSQVSQQHPQQQQKQVQQLPQQQKQYPPLPQSQQGQETLQQHQQQPNQATSTTTASSPVTIA